MFLRFNLLVILILANQAMGVSVDIPTWLTSAADVATQLTGTIGDVLNVNGTAIFRNPLGFESMFDLDQLTGMLPADITTGTLAVWGQLFVLVVIAYVATMVATFVIQLITLLTRLVYLLIALVNLVVRLTKLVYSFIQTIGSGVNILTSWLLRHSLMVMVLGGCIAVCISGQSFEHAIDRMVLVVEWILIIVFD
jgi:hypothetical protein